MSKKANFYSGATYDPPKSLGWLIRRVVAAMGREVSARIEGQDLTQAQWGPLFMIHTCRCQTAASLARELNVDTGSMTRTLDRLEDKGFLRRERSTDDRRVVKLVLTESGERVIADIPYVLSDVLNDFLHGFTRAEHDQLFSLLSRLLENGERLQGGQGQS
ncbi:MarR family winged helix-turn-helix transcriptional regulator [Aquabacterium sp.]|uniref:MarR family winged helix-turn-helix transcriptional regulator n=1 Tax=Aquabacterium sp. TaxID=1872578 RepID=UPI0035B38B15